MSEGFLTSSLSDTTFIKPFGQSWKQVTYSAVDGLAVFEGCIILGTVTQAQAVKEVVAWHLAEAMRTQKISKARMATMLKTSRTRVDRHACGNLDGHTRGAPSNRSGISSNRVSNQYARISAFPE